MSPGSSGPTQPFGRTHDGVAVELHELACPETGLRAWVTEYGGTLVRVRENDSDVDLVLGFQDVQDYQTAAGQFHGCTIGRVANRIAEARFSIDGADYRLLANEGRHHLHGGGARRFDQVVWRVARRTVDALELQHRSPHLDEGYPGELEVRVRFRMGGGAIRIDYHATTDRTTPVSLTNHAYWNLAGRGDVLDHRIEVHAARYTPTDAERIPTGELRSVEGTALDLRRPRRVGAVLRGLGSDHADGLDHNFVLDGAPAAVLRDPASGRQLEVRTTEPGLQVYSGNHLDGRPFPRHAGICLEPQRFPDAVHHPGFFPIFLHPGESYRQETAYRISRS